MTIYERPEWLVLVQAVIERPEDDTPRLVAADWLEENGDATRANFIRVQMEMSLSKSVKKRRKLAKKAVELLNGQSKAWLGMWRKEIPDVMWGRGFAVAVGCPWPEWHAHAEAILAGQPIQTVTLESPPMLRTDEGYLSKRCWIAGFPKLDDWFFGDTTEDDILLSLLKRIWPRIKNWHLPVRMT